PPGRTAAPLADTSRLQAVRWTPRSTLTPGPKLTPAQQDLADDIVNELRHEIASTAASPLTAQYPEGSIQRVTQQRILARNAPSREAARVKAQALFDRPEAQQRQVFGRFAGVDPNAARVRSDAVDPVFKAKVQKVLDEDQPVNSELAQQLKAPSANLPKPRTYAEMILSKELSQYAMHLTINEPQKIRIRWNTEEEDASYAVWTIQGSVGAPAPKIAKGNAGSAPGGEFTLDLADILPPAPPDNSVSYFIRIQPMTSGRSSDPAGPASLPITITYEKSTYVQPAIKIEDNLGHYQALSFYVDKIKCLDETNEAADSDHILFDGFYTLADGGVEHFGLWTVSDDFDKGEVEPDDPDDRPVRQGTFFFFNTTPAGVNLLSQPPTDNHRIPWPRTYTFNLFMAERDPGGGFGEFMEAVIQKLLDKLEPIIKDHLDGLIGAGIGGAIGSAIPIPGLGTLIGVAVGAILGEALGALFDWLKELFTDSDNPLDDKRVELNLPSSSAAEIHKLPGTVKSLPNGKTEFISPTQTLTFQGLGGKYEVDVFWRAHKRVMDY
ncbi:hypothetical protein CW354_19785, partial [Marinicaulis flavus]